MNRRMTLLARMLCVAVLVSASFAAGCSGIGNSRESGTVASSIAPLSAEPEVKSTDSAAYDIAAAPPSAEGAGTASSSIQEPLVITTAGINLEVKNLDASILAVRGLATKYGATISNLSMSAGGVAPVVPQPLDGSSSDYSYPTPGGATITLRVPAEKLAAAEVELAALGRVTSQSSSQDDVTQQHVDMKARLKNLQAEESRLRTFFLKATKVSEMLAIEQELARVRGEIESMQAQITYLERQAAMATLTVSLSQPGALVSPASGGWGFAAAVRDGVRAAASVTRGLITTLLALSPMIVLAVIAFVVIRALVRRRRARKSAADHTTDAPAVEPREVDESQPS